MNNDLYDIAIIGAGPAGLSAALYARRANLKIVLIEKSAPGGKLLSISKINNYPGYVGDDGASLALNMYEQVMKFNPEFIFDEVLDVNKNEDGLFNLKTNTTTIISKNVIVAVGTANENLKVARENNFIGKGISYCATCDGKFYEGKDLAVLASNEHGFEETIYLKTFANKIYLLTDDNFDNSDFKEKILNENIDVIKNVKISKLLGEDKIEGVVLSDGKELKIDGIFPLNNSLPINTFLKRYPDIFASNGYVKVNEKMETSIAGLYAIGDVNFHDLKQVVTACNDGAIASQAIITKRFRK